ncbi:MAG: hypothetical protein A2252_06615 [Elusimicrobia bacterium RIFOXYA2_FULL_39_19]|nr:MAG: hypothetical protein A2252_06615 [Elusimicrobia bacterium RIFOXYA2_FULL_39_19]
MCFSAGASFTGSAILSVIGTLTLKKVSKPSQIVFASIPIFFAFQQFVEGVLWLVLPNTEYIAIEKAATYIFLVMAQVCWPLLIPISVLLMEESGKRRIILYILLGIGIIVALYYGCGLLFQHPHAQIKSYHIQYQAFTPTASAITFFFLYLVAAVVPLFVLSTKKIYILGMLMLLSGVVTVIFFTQFVTSVWCFFAALMSVVIYYIIKSSKKTL